MIDFKKYFTHNAPKPAPDAGSKPVALPTAFSADDWMRLLQDVSRRINLGSGDLSVTLNELIRRLIEELDIDAIAIWTVEVETNFMRAEYSVQLSDRYIRFFNKTDRIAVGQGLVGRVISERKTVLAGNLTEYQKIVGAQRWNDMLVEEGIQSLLAAPMFVGESLVGAFTIYYKNQHVFNEEESLFIEILANHIATTLKNVEIFSRMAKESIEQKNQIERLISMQQVIELLNVNLYESLDASLPSIAQYIQKQFGSIGIQIFSEDPAGGFLVSSASYGVPQALIEHIKANKIRTGDGTLAGIAFRDKNVIFASRTLTDPRIEKVHVVELANQNIMSLAAFPLLVHDRTTGVLCVYYDHVHEFSNQELSVLQTFSQFISITLENMKILASLSRERENTGSIVHSLQDGIIVYGLKHEIIEMNRSSQEILGISRNEVIGQTVETLQANKRFSLLYEIATLSISDFKTRDIVLSDPTHTVLRVTQVPLWNWSHSGGNMHILHDITTERAVERLKSSFVSTASHQLRTPLTGIKWGLETFLHEMKAEHKDEPVLIKSVAETTNSLILLVNDLLNVSRIEEGGIKYVFKPRDVMPVIEGILKEVAINIQEKKLNIVFEKSDRKLPLVDIDAKHFAIAIKNILDNAIKYTPDGGNIHIVVIPGESSLIIAITDSGIGIDRSGQGLLFNKFFRAPNAIRTRPDGSGLGLYISKSIIDGHNGRINLDSTLGKGTTFYVQLPLRHIQTVEEFQPQKRLIRT